MKTETLAWLVLLLFSAGTSGTTLSEEEDEEDSSVREMKNARVLMDLMKSKCLNRTANYNGTPSFHFYLAAMLNTKLMKSLYQTAITQLLQHQSHEAVASYVWNIHQDDGAATFALMVEMQMQMLFSNFMLVADFGNSYSKYRIDLAYYLYRIRNSELFVQLQPAVKDELENIIKLLPEELQLIFFSPQFCLKNRRLNEYLSFSFVKDGRRQIITAPFRNRTLSAPFIWQNNVIDALVGGVAIKGRANFAVSLYSKAYGNYIYLDRTRANRVFGRANGQQVDGSLWRVHYVSSAMMFEQQGIYLCATDELENEEREGYLAAGIARDSPLMTRTKCRWAIERCEERGE